MDTRFFNTHTISPQIEAMKSGAFAVLSPIYHGILGVDHRLYFALFGGIILFLAFFIYWNFLR